ncbi:MAG: NUDIX domain-containing protein [Lacrimispora saccharolytica]
MSVAERSCMTTLCYLERDGKYLMLHRTAREQDVNKDKWIGVGGHFEQGESPEECLVREVKEETGYTLTGWRFRGIVTFCTDSGLCEYMCLYTSEEFTGIPAECDEGTLEWVPKDQVLLLDLWEGDKIFFHLLNEECPFFSLKLSYQGDQLAEAVWNGKPMELFDERRADGSRTGVVMERGVAHRDGRMHGTVHTWLTRRSANRETEVLLQKRSADKESHPGCWDISSAGHLQAGDTFEEAAVRELEEELGISVGKDSLEFVGWNHDRSEDFFHGRKILDDEIAKVYVIPMDVEPEQMKLQKEEVETVQWMPLKECLKKMKDSSWKNCLRSQEMEMLREYLEKETE